MSTVYARTLILSGRTSGPRAARSRAPDIKESHEFLDPT